jgi:hypothetical protein
MGYEGTNTGRIGGEVGIEEGVFHHRAQAENLSPPMRSLSSHPSSTTLENLSGRLRCLLDQIQPILRTYAPSVHASALRIHWLQSYYSRVIEVLNQIQSRNGYGSGLALRDYPTEVTYLEKEWAGSEVVAAWFGPTRALRERVLARPAEEIASGVEMKEDWKYVGLYDEGRRE